MKTIIVFGAGRFGASVARTLTYLGNEVLIVDKDQEKIDSVGEQVTTAIVADVSDQAVTDQLGLSNFDIAVIAIGSNVEASIFSTLAAREAGIKEIYAKANSSRHAEVLTRIGANHVVFPEYDMGYRLAELIHSDKILDQVKLSKDYSIIELKCLNVWVGKTLEQLNFRKKYNAIVVAIKRGEDVITPVDPFDEFLKNDSLLLIGKNDNLNKIKDKN